MYGLSVADGLSVSASVSCPVGILSGVLAVHVSISRRPDEVAVYNASPPTSGLAAHPRGNKTDGGRGERGML